MIALLSPVFQGEWASLGETLDCASPRPPQAMPVSALLDDPARLSGVLQRHARSLGVAGPDLRATASAWTLAYLWALLPPVIAAASLFQHRFPVAAAGLAVSLDFHGVPRRFHLADEGTSLPGSGTADRYGPLLWNHLAPLFIAVSAQTRLAPKVMWGNAARYVGAVFEHLAGTGSAPPQLARDHEMLMHQAAWPGGCDNPLHPRVRPDPALHRQCCLYHLLPGQSPCRGCPLHDAAISPPARTLPARSP